MKIFNFILDFILILIGIGFCIYGEYQNQTMPHHRVVTLGVTVISDEMITNPVEVTVQERQVLTPRGFVAQSYLVTNELWHVWSIWK